MADEGFKPFLGTKVIMARPKDNADGVPGYEVIYPPPRGNEPRYRSWSPKEIFEACHRGLLEGETQMVVDHALDD